MGTISLTQKTSKSLDEVKQIAESLAGDLKQKFDIDSKWIGERAMEFQRKGLQGSLQVVDEAVKIDMRLGMMLSAFSTRIKTELQREMAERLG